MKMLPHLQKLLNKNSKKYWAFPSFNVSSIFCRYLFIYYYNKPILH